MALETRIQCNGIKPTKAMVYTLAAELVEVEGIIGFGVAIIEAFKSYEYYEDYDYEYYYEYYYDYDYYYDYYKDYYYYNEYDYYKDYYYYYELSQAEKVIALLFLAAMYS
jgi:hypothetical protein